MKRNQLSFNPCTSKFYSPCYEHKVHCFLHDDLTGLPLNCVIPTNTDRFLIKGAYYNQDLITIHSTTNISKITIGFDNETCAQQLRIVPRWTQCSTMQSIQEANNRTLFHASTTQFHQPISQIYYWHRVRNRFLISRSSAISAVVSMLPSDSPV